MIKVDIGDLCVECWNSTAFGDGRFVNRIPAECVADLGHDKGFVEVEVTGFMCEECQHDYNNEGCGKLGCEDCYPKEED